MTKNKKIRDLNPAVNNRGVCGISTEYLEYKNLLLNAVEIKGLDYIEETFVKAALIENGKVGYDLLVKRWANVYGEGLNDYGNPTQLTFVLPNKQAYQRPAYYKPDPDGAYMINALPCTFPLADVIHETTDLMQKLDNAINQNIDACRAPCIVVVKDENLQLSVQQAIQQREQGCPVIVTSTDVGEGLKGLSLDTPYLVDKFAQYRDMERDHLLNKLGIMSANINKRERVQVGEVNATVGQCVDYIYLLIDTFNKQMRTYGLPFKMVMNGALEELYTEDETDETDETKDNNPSFSVMDDGYEEDVTRRRDYGD